MRPNVVRNVIAYIVFAAALFHLSFGGSEGGAQVCITLMAATADDFIFLSDLYKEDRRAEFEPLGLTAPMLMQLLEQQHRAKIASHASQFPEASDAIVWYGGERVGRMLVARGLEELHLVDIVLLEGYRGRGIGLTLLSRLCDEASARNLPVRLSVRVGNPAKRLYMRAGFVAFGGDEVNIRMEWRGSMKS